MNPTQAAAAAAVTWTDEEIRCVRDCPYRDTGIPSVIEVPASCGTDKGASPTTPPPRRRILGH